MNDSSANPMNTATGSVGSDSSVGSGGSVSQTQNYQNQNNQKPKNRCTHCNCKLGGTPFQCRCSKIFCINHLAAGEHACTFNYRVQTNEILARQLNTDGLSVKVDKI